MVLMSSWNLSAKEERKLPVPGRIVERRIESGETATLKHWRKPGLCQISGDPLI
jgi:hypothetical protein